MVRCEGLRRETSKHRRQCTGTCPEGLIGKGLRWCRDGRWEMRTDLGKGLWTEVPMYPEGRWALPPPTASMVRGLQGNH